MENQEGKQMHIIKVVVYIVLFFVNLWYAVDSFCEYAETLKGKAFVSGMSFVALLFFFAWRAIVDYKHYKAKRMVNKDE